MTRGQFLSVVYSALSILIVTAYLCGANQQRWACWGCAIGLVIWLLADTTTAVKEKQEDKSVRWQKMMADMQDKKK